MATVSVMPHRTHPISSIATVAATFTQYLQHTPRDLADGNLVFKGAKVPAANLTASALNGTSPALNGTASALNGTASALNGTATPPPYFTGLHGVNIELDTKLVKLMWLTIFVAVGITFMLRLLELGNAYIRNAVCMTRTRREQAYYTLDHFPLWSWLKKNLIYAPLGKKRHNRELQLSSVINYGTIPGRIHFLLLFVYALSQIAYCVMLDWKASDKGKLMAELRGRSGILATVNMLPLVVLAGRNNPCIALLRVSFDTYNLFHRWIGRICVLQSLVHVSAWMAAYIMAKGEDATIAVFVNNSFLQFGLIAVIAIVILALHSLSPIRHAFYETFLHLHQFLALAAFLGVYVHLCSEMLPAFPFILAVVVFWLIERLWRLGRILRLNYSRLGGKTSMMVEALPANACRVTYQLPRHITIRPGSHVYAYIPWISLWQSHPFSVAWTNIESGPPIVADMVTNSDSTDLEGQTSNKLIASTAPTTVSLIVCARSGMTKNLYEKARESNNNKLFLSGFIEGPYAGHDSMVSYGTVIMFAGGGGITHHLIQIRHLLLGAKAQTVATRKIVLVWSIRDVDAMEWVKPWMTEILAMEGRRDVLSIRVYASKPSVPINTSKAKPTMQIIEGRCDPGAVLDEIIPQRVGATMVSVCGPGALADSVRHHTRRFIGSAAITLNEESFTW